MSEIQDKGGSMGLIEQIARDMAKARGHDPDQPMPQQQGEAIHRRWETYAAVVRFVFNALREPSAPMVLAGDKRMRQHGTAFQTFRAMIDAELPPGERTK